MNGTRVRVRRERPTALAWSIALAVTMLAVYMLTLSASLPDAVESASASPRVTREVTFEPLEGWCVSMGTWPTEDQARIEAAGYAASGAAGCPWEADGQWHLLGTLADSQKQAERMAKKLRDDGIEAEALCLSAEKVKLRVTAPEAQIERITEAIAMLNSQSEQLSDAARQLDRGTLQPEAARTLCALAATETGTLAERLAVFPGAGDNALCVGLMDALVRLSGHLGEIADSAQTAAPALSGMLRMAGIDSFLHLKALQESIGR